MIPKLRAAAAIACAAITLPATAQEWRIELSNPTLTPTAPSTDVTLIAVMAPGDYTLASAAWSTHASESGWDASSFESLLAHPGQRAGELSPDGRSVLEQMAWQGVFCTFTTCPEPVTPVRRGTFTATDFHSREITIATATDLFGVHIVIPGLPPEVELRTPTEGRAVIQVIPAPGTLAALGLTALTTTRRRRHA